MAVAVAWYRHEHGEQCRQYSGGTVVRGDGAARGAGDFRLEPQQFTASAGRLGISHVIGAWYFGWHYSDEFARYARYASGGQPVQRGTITVVSGSHGSGFANRVGGVIA